MALIIRAAAISPVSRQLRRRHPVGVVPVAAVGALTDPTVAEVTAAPAVAPAAPVPVAAAAAPVPSERAELQQQADQLRQEQQALVAAKADIAQERQQLARQQQELKTAQQQLADEAEQIKTEAERRGYAHGRELGMRESADATAAQVARLNAVVQALSQSKRAQLDENEDALVELAFTAVCRVLGVGASSRAGIESMVAQLIAVEREPATLRVRLHPQDVALMTGSATLDPRLEFLPDAGIELGGCLLEGPRGTLDARLELQVQHLRASLLQVRQQRGQNEAPV